MLALSLLAAGAGSALAQPATSPGSKVDAAAVGAAVGQDVGKRWCAGEEPREAIEKALITYLTARRIAPADLPQQTAAALGREIAVEAFAQAFASCPQRARVVLRTIMG